MPGPNASDPSAPLATRSPWHRILTGPERSVLESQLPRHLASQRWFGAKARPAARVRIRDAVSLGRSDACDWLVLADVEYLRGPGETYVLPLAWSESLPGRAARVALLEVDGRPGVIHAAEQGSTFASGLLADIEAGRVRRGARGVLLAHATKAFDAHAVGAGALEPAPLAAEQSNTSIRFGDRLILKLYRKTAPGVNPDLEVGEYLTLDVGFPHVPPALGSIVYRPDVGEPMSVAFLQGFVKNEGDAWRLTLQAVREYLARVCARPGAPLQETTSGMPPTSLRHAPEDIGHYLDLAALLGQRTAELHLALAADVRVRAFCPEAFTLEWQAGLHEALSRQAETSFAHLEQQVREVSGADRPLAVAVLAHRGQVSDRIAWLRERLVSARRIRIHGDYHLGQVLWTGADFVIIDFEGEPARPLADRRGKESALRDVAGMIRSFHYAARAGAADAPGSHPTPESAEWLRQWYSSVSVTFLQAYLRRAGNATFLPQEELVLRELLEFHLLEKALYELDYELNNRPGWVGLPLAGLAELLGVE